MWDYNKISNIHIIRVPKGEKKEGRDEKALEKTMTENFPSLAKHINLQIQEAKWTPNSIRQKKSTPRHIIVKLLKTKDKERILKALREKQHLTYKRKTIQMTADFSSEIMEWHNIQVLKDSNCQPRILYSEMKVKSRHSQVKEN